MKETIYERHGRLAMYDKGVDGSGCHCVMGYQVSWVRTGK